MRIDARREGLQVIVRHQPLHRDVRKIRIGHVRCAVGEGVLHRLDLQV
jgi:hypothetical protein